MSEVQQVVQRYYDCFAAGDFAATHELFADDCVTVMPMGSVNQTEHEAMGRAFKSALPDARMDVTRTVQAGDEVYVTGRFKGTHSGDLVTPGGTLPASGKALDLPFVDYWRVEDGKIVAHEATFDQMAMLSQLGAGPAQ
jgi:steroid delta-isomerase-like uncharacterized protein